MHELFEKQEERYEENIFEPNNQVVISGKLGEINFSHWMRNNKYYSSVLHVTRFSGIIDEVPLIIQEKHLNKAATLREKQVEIRGCLRTRNFLDSQGSHLQIYLYTKELNENCKEDDGVDDNYILLDGFICKPTVYRLTPAGKRITDMLVAVNRANGYTDYIPCIAWNEIAKKLGEKEVGEQVRVYGRIQSRKYWKVINDVTQEKETRVAYEVSIFQYNE